MSECAAPMLSPCKPHKGSRATWPPCPEKETWHHTLLSTSRACMCPNLLHLFFPPSRSYLQTKEPASSCKAQAATMSLAPSIPSIKVKVGSVTPPHRVCRSFAVIRSSKAEGPIRRPAALPTPRPPKTPALATPPSLSQPPKLSAPTSSSPPPSSPPEPKPVEAAAPAATVQRPVTGAVTLEYQRKVAKELQDYFKQKKLEEVNQGPFFGFLPKNEISNGRYVCPARCINFCEQSFFSRTCEQSFF
jgi:hypothetical protein